jgi:mannosyltransferase
MEASTARTPAGGTGPGEDGDTSGPPTAGPEPAPRTGARRLARLRQLRDGTLIAPPAVTLAMMLWGLKARAYWGDEGDTVSAVSRSLPQLARLLGRIDAVHGLYYLLLWPVAAVAGSGEFATRLPSALAMAAAALGVAVIGRRLGSRRAGLWAGLVFAVLPEVTVQGHDARPYAMVTAAAVLASLVMIRVIDDPRPSRLAAYGLSLALLGYLELFALLLVATHAITLIGLRGRPILRGPPARRWLATVTAVGVACAPVAAWGVLQRGEIAWIRRPTWFDVGYLVSWLTLGSAASAALIGLLAVLGGTASGPPPASRPRALTWLAAPWLVLPPLLLMTASEIRPVYSFRYAVFCLPAVALLAGAGLAVLGRPGRFAAVGLIVSLALPAQLTLRVPVSGMRAAAQVLADRARPGDAVIYPGTGIPPWYLAYPQEFGRLHDIGLARSGPAAGRLYGTRVSLSVLLRRESGYGRIWAVETGPGWPDPARYLAPGFHLLDAFRPGNGAVWLGLYQRHPETGSGSPARRTAFSVPGGAPALGNLLIPRGRRWPGAQWQSEPPANPGGRVSQPTIGLLHPGEMGAAVGACLTRQGLAVLWASADRSPATTARATGAGLRNAGTAADLARRADVILSICPPHAALEVARSAAGFRGLYVDANAVSPAATREIAQVVKTYGASYVDGGIIGPPPRSPGDSRLYLSGQRAGEISEMFAGTALDATVIGDEPGAASAVKMAYAAWTKGTAALILAIRALARAEGVEETLLAEWGLSQPTLAARSDSAARSAAAKGWRWVAEMEEIAATMAAAGLPPGFHQAAAIIYDRAPHTTTPSPIRELSLKTVIDALLAGRSPA